MNAIRNRRGVVVAALVALSGMLVGHRVGAVSVAGSSGFPLDNNGTRTADCFVPFGLQIQYNGGCEVTNPFWTIPLPANAGVRSIAVSATNNGFLSCTLCGTNQSGLISSCVAVPSFPLFATSVQSATVTVPNNGALYLQCQLGSGSLINTVNYNQ